jgi:ADP-ribose pyrophosphatase YjhB (NUDIX family)
MIEQFLQSHENIRYRVAAVAAPGDLVLLHKAEPDDFWTLPGGAVEKGEQARAALQRELEEELNVRPRVDRLLWVVENFFTYGDRSFHELGLYFLVTFPPGALPDPDDGPFTGVEGPLRLTFRWFPRRVTVLRPLPVLPEFLPTALPYLPQQTQHIVNVER